MPASRNTQTKRTKHGQLQSIIFEAPSLLQYVEENCIGITNNSPSANDRRTNSKSTSTSSSSSTKRRSPVEDDDDDDDEQALLQAKISSLNFERVVNGYSIQATLDSLFSDGNHSNNNNNSNSHNQHHDDSTAYRFPEPQPPNNSNNHKKHTLLQTMKGNGWFQYTDQRATRWGLSALVGLVVGLLAIAIVASTEQIVAWRMASLQTLSSSQSDYATTTIIFGMFALGNVVLATLASLLCICWVPNGAGSGIPQIMAYLNGVRVHFDSNEMDHFASFRLLLVKIVGTVLSVSSFLAIGMEGPLIHIGAIVGCGCTKTFSFLLSQSQWLTTRRHDEEPNTTNNTATHLRTRTAPFTRFPMTGHDPSSASEEQATHCGCCCCVENPVTSTANSCAEGLWSWATMDLSHFANDYERRDLVSIGASCGFAASFGAPIGGLLFILDDVSSYLSKNIFFRTLVANAVGTFCLAWHHGSLSNYSVIDLGAFLENASYLGSKNNYGGGDGDNGGTTDDSSRFSDRFAEVPLYMLVGIVGGIMGGGFCYVVNALHRLRKRHTRAMTTRQVTILQIVEVIVLSIITSTLLFYLPAAVTNKCKEAGEVRAAAQHARAKEPDTEHLFFCKKGEINEMSTLLLGSRSEAIKRILTEPLSFESENLFAIGILFYVLMTLT